MDYVNKIGQTNADLYNLAAGDVSFSFFLLVCFGDVVLAFRLVGILRKGVEFRVDDGFSDES